MKTTNLLLTIASITTAVLALSIFFGYASTGALMISVTAWLALGTVNAYAPRVSRILPRSRTGVIAAAECCPKHSLRLAA